MNARKISRLASIGTAVVGAIAAAWNTARLTVPDTAAGPVDFLLYTGIPAALTALGAVGTATIRPAAADKTAPGSPGHPEFCQSVFKLLEECQYPAALAIIRAWEATHTPDGSPAGPAGPGGAV